MAPMINLLILRQKSDTTNTLYLRSLLTNSVYGMAPRSYQSTKNGSGPCLHGTQDEVGTTKHNWLAWCQYNVTGWVSLWALSPTATNKHPVVMSENILM